MNSYDVFISVVKLGSFSKAAKVLHRSPSAISKQVGIIEQQLNVQLIDRSTRTLSLTEAGQIYYKRCREITQKISDTETELKDFSGEPSGKITMTWANSLSYSKLIAVLTEFSIRYPKITFDVKVTNDYVNLSYEHVDIAFRQGPLEDSSMVAIKLFDIEAVICASPSFLERHGTPDSLSELLALPLAIPSYINFPQKMRPYFPDLKGFNIKNMHRIGDISALHQMAREGLAAALSFRHIVERELEDGSLIDITPIKTIPTFPVFLVYQQKSYMPQKLRVFIDTFKSAFS